MSKLISVDELIDTVESSKVSLAVCVPDYYNNYSGEPKYDVEYIDFIDANSLIETLKEKFDK